MSKGARGGQGNGASVTLHIPPPPEPHTQKVHEGRLIVRLNLANKHTSTVELRVALRRDGHERGDSQSVTLDQDDLCCERELVWEDVRLNSTAKLYFSLATTDADARVTGNIDATVVATPP
ncbi:MAG: hypothetical protein H7138_24830 [Myxococcales bacterium]|nr:hypothetical protein [Myxococcales bacterium]